MQEQPTRKRSLLRPVLGTLAIFGLLATFAVVASEFNPWGETSTVHHPNQLVGKLTLETRVGIEANSMQAFYTDGVTAADKTVEHIGTKKLNDLIATALGQYENLRSWKLCRAELEAAAAVKTAMVNEAIKLKSAEAAQAHTQRAEALNAALKLGQSSWIDCITNGISSTWLTFDVEVNGVWRKIAIADSAVIDPMPTAEVVNSQGMCVAKTNALRAELVAKPTPNQALELAKLDATLLLEKALGRINC